MVGLTALIAWTGAETALAQHMDEGEARITAESDVTLAVRSGPATNRDRLMEIGRVVGTRMKAVKDCYSDVVKNDPSVRGKLSFLLTLGPPVKLEEKLDEPAHKGLRSCVVKAIKSGDYSDLQKPGAAFVLLEFRNSAAEGVIRTRTRRAAEDDVKVTKTPDGAFQAEGGTPDRKVIFSVSSGSEAATSAAHRTLRGAIPTLLDCHRKAGRRDGDPSGKILVRLVISKKGAAAVYLKENTITNRHGTKQAEKCVQKGLGRVTFSEASAGRVELTLTFAREASTAKP